jgi:hypothetical protein
MISWVSSISKQDLVSSCPWHFILQNASEDFVSRKVMKISWKFLRNSFSAGPEQDLLLKIRTDSDCIRSVERYSGGSAGAQTYGSINY